jgi:hypothetical protein
LYTTSIRRPHIRCTETIIHAQLTDTTAVYFGWVHARTCARPARPVQHLCARRMRRHRRTRTPAHEEAIQKGSSARAAHVSRYVSSPIAMPAELTHRPNQPCPRPMTPPQGSDTQPRHVGIERDSASRRACTCTLSSRSGGIDLSHIPGGHCEAVACAGAAAVPAPCARTHVSRSRNRKEPNLQATTISGDRASSPGP